MKRIVSIQDISCVGKCSLTVALPIISAMGTECAIIPTAVLSAHTAFKGFTFADLTDQVEPISKHWLDLGLDFDAIYTGYLGSFEQLDLVSDFFDAHRGADTLVFVDPAMADYGRMYPGFDEEFAVAMGTKVCAKADVIVPNLTEATFMLGVPYRDDGASDEGYLREILQGLTELGAKKAVITGAAVEPNSCGVYGFDSETGEFFSYYNELVDAKYHGTGDVFSSTTVGALMRGKTLDEALAIAADYTVAAIKATEADPGHEWYGVEFEAVIPYLLERMGA